MTGRHSNQLNLQIKFLKELRFFFVIAKLQLFSLPANYFSKKSLPKAEGIHYQSYFFTSVRLVFQRSPLSELHQLICQPLHRS
jgi:hypothetical protein